TKQAVVGQSRRMQQIGKGAQFLGGLVERVFDIFKNAARALRSLERDQIEADRRQMLRGRIMQVLRDPLALVVLNTQDALRQLFGLELRDFVVGNVAENTAGPQRV